MPEPEIELLTFPRHIQLQTHSRCNMACSMCPHPELDRNADRGRMPWERFVRLMEECHQHPEFSEIVLDLQNEPLLDVELERRVALVKEMSEGRTFVGITTNGLALTPERCAALIDAGIDTIVVSLNAATARAFSRLVPRVRFDRVLANVEAALELPKGPQTLKLSFGYSDANLEELEPFFDRVREQGARYRVFPFHDRTGTISVKGLLDVPFDQGCHLPLYSLAIHYDGDAILCCQDWTRQRVLGNVFERSVAEVWQSEEFVAIRRAAALGEGLPARPCGTCKAPVHLHRIRPLHRQLAQLQQLQQPAGATRVSSRYVFVPGRPDRVIEMSSGEAVLLDAEELVACASTAAGESAEALARRAEEAGLEPSEVRARLGSLRARGLLVEGPEAEVPSSSLPRVAYLLGAERTHAVALVAVDPGRGWVRVGTTEPEAFEDLVAAELRVPLIGATVMPRLRGRVVERERLGITLAMDDAAMEVLVRLLASDDAGNPLAQGELEPSSAAGGRA